MTTYTLKLVSGVNYNLYNGATLVSDSDLATLFGSAASAFFVFDFDGGTPTNTTSLTIVDSNSQAVITNTGLSGIAENTNFNGDWSASATAFDTFVKSPAAVLDEAQMSDLMGKIKERPIVGSTLSTPSNVAYVATANIQDGAVTSDKIDSSTFNFQDGVAQVIGSYTDSNNATHNIYKKILKKTDYTTTANDPYRQYTVNLSSYTILSTELSLYRSDTATVINTTGNDLEAIYTGSGDYVRVYYHGGVAQTNATIYITITYMD